MALYLIIQIGAFLSHIVPRPWRYRIGTAVGDAVYLLWGTKRRILRENMATILGTSTQDPRVRPLAVKSMRNYCKYLIEFLELPLLSPDHHIIRSMPIDGVEHLERALEKGKGVILATAHFGTIEVGGLRLARYTDYHAVYDTFKPAYLDRLIQRKRKDKGINLISTSNVKGMLRVLRAGGTLALLFDRPVDPARGVPVRFFGHDTAVPGGPALLALRTGATLLPVYLYRLPDLTFAARVFPPVDATPTGDQGRDVRTIMQTLVDTLQLVVRRDPDQWYMFRPMWPERRQSVPALAPERGADAGLSG